MCKVDPVQPPPRRVVVRCTPGTRVPSELRPAVPHDVLTHLEKRVLPRGSRDRAARTGEGKRSPEELVADLRATYRVVVPDGADPIAFATAIGRWEGARDVYLEPALALPPVRKEPARRNPSWTTNPPPAVRGARGAKVSFVDVEWGWAEHEALPCVKRVFGVPRGWWWHGNAVLGVIVGKTAQARGIAPRAHAMFASPWTPEGNYEVATALAVACTHLRPGDVLLIELQSACGEATGLPVEVDPVVADVIALAREMGILTIEAAGNGGWHLDDVCVAGRGKVIGEAGALIVGAAIRAGRERIPESCWGKAVDCWAWGEEVPTAWSNHIGTARDVYNPSFSGTSAAAAIVAGVALAVQLAARARGQTILPDEMRALLVGSGTAIPGIGVMPDLEAILAKLGLEPAVSR